MLWPQRLTVLLLTSLAAALASTVVQAQGPAKFEKARITTVDGVDLTGYFYASTKKKNPPTVLMLHALGEDSKKKNWVALAEALQAEGFAVLTFDFRGHGNSTTISDPVLFWAQQANRMAVNGKVKDSLDFKDIKSNFYTLFCNDVAAARAWLDRKNDTGACNVSNLMVIGSETGATIGSIWLNSEWQRHKLNTINVMGFVQQKPDPRQEGKDVVAAIWLSMSSKLGNTPIPVGRVLETSARGFATPMAFMHGADDIKGKDYAKQLVNSIKKGKEKDKDKYANTDTVAVPGTKLQGQGLLLNSLKTDESIITYLNRVLDDRNQEWFDREFRKSEYMWMTGGPNGVAAKLKGGDPNNMNYDTYSKFIPR